MKIRKLFVITIILTCLMFCSCFTKNDELLINEDTTNIKQNLSTTVYNESITVLEFTNYLKEQEEHYPISDEFIEKYQQNSGGYIALAKSMGIVVDRQLHSPNQKWHFFESWFQECLTNNTISYEDDAKKNIYNRLLCPELLLWIYEACKVDPVKVKDAMEQAVIGKVEGTHVSTIAKNMRLCVTWEDIIDGLNSNDNLRIEGIASTIDLSLNEKLLLSPVLNKEEGTFTYTTSDSLVVSVTNDGVITAVNYGSAIITITSVEHEDLVKNINVEVFDHGSLDKPLSVLDIEALQSKICLETNEYTNEVMYVKAIVKEIKDNTLVIKDLNDDSSSIEVSNYTCDKVVSPAVNDEIILKGYLKNVSGKLLFTSLENSYVEILDNIRGTSLITLMPCSNAQVKIDDTLFEKSIYIKNGETFNFTVAPDEGFNITSVIVNGNKLTDTNGIYSFEVSGDMVIVINVVNQNSPNVSIYNVSYDLGTRVTAKKMETFEELFNSFVNTTSQSGIISSITEMNYIYGGANGGRGETSWYTEDIIKIGTTSVNGSMTINLNIEINYVKITGYVYDAAAKIQVGDSNDVSKATLYTCSNMTVANKDSVGNNQVSTMLITFDNTSSLKIETTNKKPIFITSIEFGVNNENA